MNRFVLFLILVGIPSWASAQTPFESVVDKVRSQPLVLPTQATVIALTPADKANPRQSFAVQRTYAADGSFTTEWKGPRYQSIQAFRADGTLLSGVQTDTAKDTTVETKTDPGRTTVRTIITEKGTAKSDKKAGLKPTIVLREELQHLVAQAWAAGIRDGLKFPSLSPDGGLVGDFQVVFKPMTDPAKASDKYTFPAEFRSALTEPSYVVVDMSLLGVGSFFYPHHFFLVYKPTATGLQFLAYFGEDPQKPVFQYVSR